MTAVTTIKRLITIILTLILTSGCANPISESHTAIDTAVTSVVAETTVTSVAETTEAKITVASVEEITDTEITVASAMENTEAEITVASATENTEAEITVASATENTETESTVAFTTKNVETEAIVASTVENAETKKTSASTEVTSSYWSKETTAETEISDYEVSELSTRVVLDVKNIQQLPELPAGCEITSTTIAMRYMGFDVDKMSMLEYMPIMKWPDEDGLWDSPWNKFIGDPKLSYYGAYSPVIKKTIEAYFASNKITGYEVVDLKDSSVSELYDQIDEGYPVIVWATIKMGRSKPGNSWKLQDGSSYTWVAGEHCLVLIGYDLEADTVILSDPYDKKGTVEYSRETFEKRYIELFQQALVIRPTETE